MSKKTEERYLKITFEKVNGGTGIAIELENLDTFEYSIALFSVAQILKANGDEDVLKVMLKKIEENVLA